MPLPQAMSMGLPSIVTNWSGTADFVDESVGYLVNYTLSKASPRFYYDDICISVITLAIIHIHQVQKNQPWWFRGARWADVSVDHLRKVEGN